MRALNDNVIVIAQLEERKSASGLYIPDTAQEGQVIRGTVVEVGPGRLLEGGNRSQMSVAAKDVVMFPKFNASKMEIGGTTYYVLAEQLILAVL